jgi:mono/diheme cytochrome c family protein
MTVHTPIETRSGGVPPWAIVLTLLVLLVGGVYLVSNLAGENPPFAIPGASEAPPTDGPAGPDPAVGQGLVNQAQPQCTACHGADLTGGVGPTLHDVESGPVSENLQDLAAEYPDEWVALWIAGEAGGPTDGIDRMGMPAYADQFSPEQIESIVAYLQTLP